MNAIKTLYDWLFQRLPRAFSIPLLVLLAAYFLLLFPLLTYSSLPRLTAWVMGYCGILADWQPLAEIVEAVLVILLVIAGVLAAYNISAWLYSKWRPRPMPRVEPCDPVLPSFSASAPGADGPLEGCSRIGIILAGGGAKGAYQAGAMKAIYEFLEKHRAHNKVKMIAGTSIGSWNAMFWLADLIKGKDGEMGLHEKWWSHVDARGVIRPDLYMPFARNYLLSSEPWQEVFDRLFLENTEVKGKLQRHLEKPDDEDSIHFYLTRSNVALGQLEFSTNRRDLPTLSKRITRRNKPLPIIPPDQYTLASSVDDIKQGVFASMDLPPLFQYMNIRGETFEDGGVVDNLPVRFGTEIEECDLLFILPLNASYEAEPDRKLISKRLFRVMDVRQGVLERNSLKLTYLYNELSVLRGLAATALGKEILSDPEHDTYESRALRRAHSTVKVFAICPGPELAINTAEFWKTKEAGQAYRLMYEYTGYELEKFDFTADQNWIKIAIVSPHGKVSYVEDF